MRIIDLCLPMLGGIYGVFSRLREGLTPLGHTISWLACGRGAALAAAELPAEGPFGEVVASHADDAKMRASALLDYITTAQPALVIFNVLGGVVETNIARFLQRSIPRVLTVHNMTPATYRAAWSIRDSVDTTVCVSPRIRRDLVRSFGFDPDRTVVIPNSFDPGPYAGLAPPSRGSNSALRVLSMGRIEDSSKGVLYIPEICRRALDAGVRLELTIAGGGPDLDRLRKAIADSGLAGITDFAGPFQPQSVPSLVGTHDVLLFPSRFEGFGITLIEAMAGGCVPVASRITGVTDYIIEDGYNGLLFPVGSVKAAAGHITRLAGNRELLARLSLAGAASSTARFTITEQASAYDALFKGLGPGARPTASLPLSSWEIPRGLRPAWWCFLPSPIKNMARVARARLT